MQNGLNNFRQLEIQKVIYKNSQLEEVTDINSLDYEKIDCSSKISNTFERFLQDENSSQN